MENKNVVTKKYMEDNERFADLCNFLLFDGQRVIRPDDLEEQDVTELGIFPKGKKKGSVEKIRDIQKNCMLKRTGDVMYLIIGVENQSEVHYAMAVRNMLQDALNYEKQVKIYERMHRRKKDLKGAEFLSGFAKGDKLVPVITITILWNSGVWDGARNLHEMFCVQDERVLRFVPDYKLNLIVPEEIEDFERFSTELGTVLQICSCASDKNKMKQLLDSRAKEGMYLDLESAEVVNECLNAGIKLPEEEGVKIDMCKALEDWKEELLETGMEKGMEKGREEGKLETLLELTREGILAIEVAADKAGISVEEFGKLLEN